MATSKKEEASTSKLPRQSATSGEAGDDTLSSSKPMYVTDEDGFGCNLRVHPEGQNSMVKSDNSLSYDALRTLWDSSTAYCKSPKRTDENINTAMREIDQVLEKNKDSSQISAFLHRLKGECFFILHNIEKDKIRKARYQKLSIRSSTKAVELEPKSIEYHTFLALISYQSNVSINLNNIDPKVLAAINSGTPIQFIDPRLSLFLKKDNDSETEERIEYCFNEYEKFGRNEIAFAMWNAGENVKKAIEFLECIESKYKVSKTLSMITCRFLAEFTCSGDALEDSKSQMEIWKASVDYALKAAKISCFKSIECCYYLVYLLRHHMYDDDDLELLHDTCLKGLGIEELDEASIWIHKIAKNVTKVVRDPSSIEQYKDEFEQHRVWARKCMETKGKDVQQHGPAIPNQSEVLTLGKVKLKFSNETYMSLKEHFADLRKQNQKREYKEIVLDKDEEKRFLVSLGWDGQDESDEWD
ncbi:hypothetical protein ACHQM5_015194 [Ranunculus cassubicifolius]